MHAFGNAQVHSLSHSRHQNHKSQFNSFQEKVPFPRIPLFVQVGGSRVGCGLVFSVAGRLLDVALATSAASSSSHSGASW